VALQCIDWRTGRKVMKAQMNMPKRSARYLAHRRPYGVPALSAYQRPLNQAAVWAFTKVCKVPSATP
jgi:hypothetical protein